MSRAFLGKGLFSIRLRKWQQERRPRTARPDHSDIAALLQRQQAVVLEQNHSLKRRLVLHLLIVSGIDVLDADI